MNMQMVAVIGLALVVAVLGLMMASEISFSASLQASKSGATVNGAASVVVTMAGTVCFSNTQSISNAATEAIDFGEAPFSVGYLYLKNLDGANFVEIGLNTPLTQKFLKLRPGEVFCGPVASSTIYALANTAPVNLQVIAAEL